MRRIYVRRGTSASFSSCCSSAGFDHTLTTGVVSGLGRQIASQAGTVIGAASLCLRGWGNVPPSARASTAHARCLSLRTFSMSRRHHCKRASFLPCHAFSRTRVRFSNTARVVFNRLAFRSTLFPPVGLAHLLIWTLPSSSLLCREMRIGLRGHRVPRRRDPDGCGNQREASCSPPLRPP